MAADRVAAALLVLGNGVVQGPRGWELTPGSAARAEAAAEFVAAHGAPPVIVFSGGWAQAREGAGEPPDGCREATLMRAAAGLDDQAGVHAECESRSTLENLLNSVVHGPLAGMTFDADRPLAVVTHRWHRPRVHYLAAKVLGLRGPALLDVAAEDATVGGLFEHAVRVVSRVWFLGTGDPAALLRRERRLVALMRRV